MSVLALLLTLTAVPGQAVYVAVPDRDSLEAVTLSWGSQEVSLVDAGDHWYGLLGVDLDVAPDSYKLAVSYRYENQAVADEAVTLDVVGKDYPTTRLTVEPKYVALSEENQQRAAAERKQIRKAYASSNSAPYWSEGFAVPIPGEVGGRNFGHRRVFNEQPRAPHSGADLTAKTGTEIYSTNDGKVLLTGDFFFNGKAVFVDHGMGVISMYLHLSEILVEDGDAVAKGQLLGLAGATGRVTGPHLHWGVRVGGARVDPFSLPGIDTEADFSGPASD